MENKIEISIPEGMEIDTENSVLKKGKIVFKNKENTINTWEDLLNKRLSREYECTYVNDDSSIEEGFGSVMTDPSSKNLCPNEKVAKKILATSQIAMLIEYGYGGLITQKEWENDEICRYVISPTMDSYLGFDIYGNYYSHRLIAFRTEKEAKRFLKYNLQLIKDFYMID